MNMWDWVIFIYIGVKRIMQEARELANESTYDYDAHPLEVSWQWVLNMLLLNKLMVLWLG